MRELIMVLFLFLLFEDCKLKNKTPLEDFPPIVSAVNTEHPVDSMLTVEDCNGTGVLMDRFIKHLNSKKKSIVPISISMPAIVPEKGPAFRMFYIIVEDSVLREITEDSVYCKEDYKMLLEKKWNTEYDWSINALLYLKNNQSALHLQNYVPDKVDQWRRTEKLADSVFWFKFYGLQN